MWLFYALLGDVLWSLSDVTNSVLVKHYEKDPIVLSWVQGMLDVAFFIVLSRFVDVHSAWVWPFALAGACTYLGFLTFFHVLHRVDVSVMNAAWAFLTLFMSIVGFVFFGEIWSVAQSLGVVLVLGGVLFLSYWHRHVSIPRTLLLLSLLGLLYVPIFATQKAALLQGESIVAVFFWPVFAEKFIAFVFPWIHRAHRAKIVSLRSRLSVPFLLLNVLATSCSITGYFVVAKAYALGLASLVTVTENTQPFFAIFFAWLLSHVVSFYAPRELLTAQSVRVKLVSFAVVFAGLALLAM